MRELRGGLFLVHGEDAARERETSFPEELVDKVGRLVVAAACLEFRSGDVVDWRVDENVRQQWGRLPMIGPRDFVREGLLTTVQ